jgi:RNA 2',3'-cyclic 3'-phosphodiesterase
VASETTRAFLALGLPDGARAAAGELLRELRGRLGGGDVKWVDPGNLHVTLRFFGDLDAAGLARARELTAAWDGAFEPFPSGWTELGAFPSPRRPQVIWLGLRDEKAALAAFAREIEQRLVRAGFGRADKPFRAHVTLGRVRRDRRVAWERASDGLTMPAADFSIRRLVLMKSALMPAGPIYTPLETATARGERDHEEEGAGG